MKTLMIRFAVAASLVFGFSANAADTAPRKEAVLDTGKGGLRLVFSVSGFAEGPIDFAGNKGAVVQDMNRIKYREAAFNAQVGETGGIVYKAVSMHRVKVESGDQMITPEFLAAELLKSEGFKLDRATKIDSPPVPIADATIVTYKASGYPLFEKEKRTVKASIIVTAVATNDKMQGFSLLTVIRQKDVAAFDADPEKFYKMAKGGFVDAYKNLEITRN